MYAIEIIIGTVLTLSGLLVLAYILYLYLQKTQSNVSILHLSEAIATVLIGVFHVASAIVISMNMQSMDKRSNVTFNENGEMGDIFDSNNFYNTSMNVMEDMQQNATSDTLGDFMKSYKFKFNKTVEQHVARMLGMQDCDFEEIYLKYAMLVVSFIYGMISMVISTIECKKNKIELNPAKNDDDTSDEKVFTKRAARLLNEPAPIEKSSKKKDLAQVSIAYLIPILYTLVVYYSMKQNFPDDLVVIKKFDIKPTPTEIKDIIEKPMNVSTSGSKMMVDEIVDKIYSIVAEARESAPQPNIAPYPHVMYDIVDHFNNRNGRAVDLMCDYKNMPMKLHTLLLFVVGYFLVLFYTKNTHTKLEMSKQFEQKHVSSLRKHIIAFGALWLPSVLEIFTRTYLMDYRPGVTSDVFLAVGNVTRVLANVNNALTVKESVKQRTNAVHSA